MFPIEKTVLVVVDVQGKLAQLMHQKDELFRNLQILIRGAQALELPVLWCEQNPAGLGPTVPELATLLAGREPIAKMSFSCVGDSRFMESLARTGRSQVLLAGIEAHVCIYLTAADLTAAGYTVQVVADAVSSRRLENKQIGFERIRESGAGITCVETVLFELLCTATHPKFKEIVRLLK